MKQAMATASKILMISLLLASCTEKPQEVILGKWKDADGITTEFFQDGTMTMKNPKEEVLGSDTISGHWTILDDGKLKLSFSIMGTTQIQTGKLRFPSKDTMELIDEQNHKSVMTRQTT